MFGIDGRYATALYSAAYKQKKLESVEGELKAVQVSAESQREKAKTGWNNLTKRVNKIETRNVELEVKRKTNKK